MKNFLPTLVGILFLPLCVWARPDHPVEHQLVTVRVTYQAWNEYRPWQKSQPSTRTFLGTVVGEGQILVPSYYLNDANLIQVEKFDRPPRVPARITHRDPQVGLAILTVDEPEFFDDLTPVELAKNTEGETYYCAAWKSGQLTLSACRWSQAKVFKSSVPYFGYTGLYFITDLKNGGRGEPVFSGKKMIGLTRSQHNDRITVVPVELIQSYLEAIKKPTYPGYGRLGADSYYNQGEAQSAYFGQSGKPSGVRVATCFPGGSADGLLLPDDILLELDGHTITSQGDYLHPQYGLMGLNLIATEGHYAGDILSATVLRDGKELKLDIPLKNIPASAALIPEARPDEAPSYLVAGGFIFRELDVPYLRAWGDKWSSNIPSYLRIQLKMNGESPTPEQGRLIVLTDVFPDEYNLGYHDMSQTLVKTVNGHSIDSIAKMEKAFQDPQNGFHIIEFMPSYGVSKVILDAKTFTAATTRIMETYQIPERIRIRP